MSDFYDYLSDPRVEHIRKFLKNKKFTSSDLGVAYRVINHWDEQGLFSDDREDKKITKWRRFSFTDIVWVEIIKELRKYGLSLEKLLHLKQTVLDTAAFLGAHSLEYQVFLTMAKTPVNLLVYEDGLGLFISNEKQFTNKFIKGYLNKNLDRKSFIVLDLNRIVGKLFPNKNTIPQFQSLSELDDDEVQLINFIRFNSFDEIRVVLNDGKLSRFEGKNSEKVESDIIDIIKKDKFQKIEVLVAGNNVVRINRTVQKKL